MSVNPLQQAHFMLAAHRVRQLPPDAGVEVAFAGRSNAGKSSAINRIVAQKSLARTSRTPGRTQQMVVFNIAPERRLVDLPGYGYAKVPQTLRAHWQAEIDSYLRDRQCLRGVILVADSRHALKPFDEQMIAFCAASQLTCHVLLTKIDKLSRNQAGQALHAAEALADEHHWPATFQSFSAHDGTGVDAARETVVTLLGLGR